MLISVYFFFNDTATTEIYTLSLHDALPISEIEGGSQDSRRFRGFMPVAGIYVPLAEARELSRAQRGGVDRKSTRLNSSHANISYAVFCLKKKQVTAILILTSYDRNNNDLYD